jgi:hypothetical protein
MYRWLCVLSRCSMILLVLASANIAVVPDHRLHPVRESPSGLSGFTSICGWSPKTVERCAYEDRRWCWRREHPHRLWWQWRLRLADRRRRKHMYSGNGGLQLHQQHELRNRRAATGKQSCRRRRSSHHVSTVWFHLTPDSGLIDFFPSKLMLDCARTPRYADDQKHDSPSISCAGRQI